jgi:acyl carrier protein
MTQTDFPAADPRVPEILAIVSRETGVARPRLQPAATIEDLGIPSLDMAQTLFALESHFDVEIPVVAERAGTEFTTVADLVSHVLATLDARIAAPGVRAGDAPGIRAGDAAAGPAGDRDEAA